MPVLPAISWGGLLLTHVNDNSDVGSSEITGFPVEGKQNVNDHIVTHGNEYTVNGLFHGNKVKMNALIRLFEKKRKKRELNTLILKEPFKIVENCALKHFRRQRRKENVYQFNLTFKEVNVVEIGGAAYGEDPVTNKKPEEKVTNGGQQMPT